MFCVFPVVAITGAGTNWFAVIIRVRSTLCDRWGRRISPCSTKYGQHNPTFNELWYTCCSISVSFCALALHALGMVSPRYWVILGHPLYVLKIAHGFEHIPSLHMLFRGSSRDGHDGRVFFEAGSDRPPDIACGAGLK